MPQRHKAVPHARNLLVAPPAPLSNARPSNSDQLIVESRLALGALAVGGDEEARALIADETIVGVEKEVLRGGEVVDRAGEAAFERAGLRVGTRSWWGGV